MLFFSTRNIKFLHNFLAKKQVSLSAVLIDSSQNFFLPACSKPAFRRSLWLELPAAAADSAAAGRRCDQAASGLAFRTEELNHLQKL